MHKQILAVRKHNSQGACLTGIYQACLSLCASANCDMSDHGFYQCLQLCMHAGRKSRLASLESTASPLRPSHVSSTWVQVTHSARQITQSSSSRQGPQAPPLTGTALVQLQKALALAKPVAQPRVPPQGLQTLCNQHQNPMPLLQILAAHKMLC